MREGNLEIDGLRVFYREIGRGEPAVLLQCAEGTGSQWRKLMDRMQGRFPFMAIDFLSSGQSDKASTDAG